MFRFDASALNPDCIPGRFSGNHGLGVEGCAVVAYRCIAANDNLPLTADCSAILSGDLSRAFNCNITIWKKTYYPGICCAYSSAADVDITIRRNSGTSRMGVLDRAPGHSDTVTIAIKTNAANATFPSR